MLRRTLVARPSLRLAQALPRTGTLRPIRFYSDETAKAEPQAANESQAEPSELETLRAKFEAKDKEAAQYKERWQHSVADFRNLQKTAAGEMEKAKSFALQKFAKDLIESVDNFDLAMKAVDESHLKGDHNKEFAEFHKGIHMVQQVLERTLDKHGVSKMVPIGEKYDPNLHEALFQVPQEGKEPGTIFHVDRTGFQLNGRVLRAPKVGIVADQDNN